MVCRLVRLGPSGRFACLAGCTRSGRDGPGCDGGPRVCRKPDRSPAEPLCGCCGRWRGMWIASLWPSPNCNQPSGDPPRSVSPLLGGRSCAVFSEGADSGPLDRGKAPEACEIGGTRRPSGELAMSLRTEGCSSRPASSSSCNELWPVVRDRALCRASCAVHAGQLPG